MNKTSIFALTLALVTTSSMVAAATHGQNATQSAQSGKIDETATAGPYRVTLEVLPAESFSGNRPEMTWESGAKPWNKDTVDRPNHHLVVFVKRDGTPVEDAKVDLRYRRTDGGSTAERAWQKVPVARMFETGTGLETTHYGNNVELPPGSYEVQAEVNGHRTTFDFLLSMG